MLRRIAVAFVALFIAVAGARAGDNFTDSAVEVVVGNGHGSGVYIGNGFVLTAAHVVGNADGGTVTIKRPRSADWADTWDGVVLWTDVRQDFALVRIRAVLTDDLPKSKVSCNKPALGDNVTIVGWPVNLGRVQSRGYIASDVDKRGPWAVSYVMVAPIYFGNSGGPVYDSNGNVVALAVGILQGTSLSLIIPTASVCDQLPAGAVK